MPTRRNRSAVSAAFALSRIRVAAVLVAALAAGACAGRQRPVTQTGRADMLQFDNMATVYVDVYLVGAQLQWRLGRVPPGMRTTLRVPESTIQQALGFVQLVVIPGSQASVEASRDPRAVMAVAQPMTEVLSNRWTFRQETGRALQLQATRLRGR